MLTRRTSAALIAMVATPLLLATASANAQVPESGDPNHACAVDPTSAACSEWLENNPPVDDEFEPLCYHLGAYVPCRSPLRFQGKFGWWVGDVAGGRWGWSFLHRGDPSRIDDPEKGRDHTHGCWGYLVEHTGSGTGVDSPGGNPEAEGAWYLLLCLGDQPYSTSIDLTALPGYHEELAAWRRTGSRPVGDPEKAARNALAALNIGSPAIVTAPPSTGSVPLGMPVWLAVDEGDPSRWGRLSGTGCDGSLCVTIEAWVDELEWRLGDGQVLRCDRSQNVIWRLGMDYLSPGQACHHYYEAPSRDLEDERYQVEVIARWRTYWEAPSLGRDGYLDHSLPPASTSIRVVEIQVLVSR